MSTILDQANRALHLARARDLAAQAIEEMGASASGGALTLRAAHAVYELRLVEAEIEAEIEVAKRAALMA